MNNNTKIGRNDLCLCDSGKKYKACCLQKHLEIKQLEEYTYLNGQEKSTEFVELIMEYLRSEYIDHKVIDISDNINKDNYRNYQVRHYNNTVIMVAEKNESNKNVFEGRGPSENDIIIMYRGSYRTFKKNDLDKVVESIDKMIQTRLAGNNDVS